MTVNSPVLQDRFPDAVLRPVTGDQDAARSAEAARATDETLPQGAFGRGRRPWRSSGKSPTRSTRSVTGSAARRRPI